jgi:hypothetical protein
MAQKPPIRIEASSLGTSKPATFIFLHGYGDDAEGWISETFSLHTHDPYILKTEATQ